MKLVNRVAQLREILYEASYKCVEQVYKTWKENRKINSNIVLSLGFLFYMPGTSIIWQAHLARSRVDKI